MEPPAVIEGGEPISRAEIAYIEASQVERNGDKCGVIVNSELDTEKHKQLGDLLKEFSDVFAFDPKRPAVTNKIVHFINIGMNAPPR